MSWQTQYSVQYTRVCFEYVLVVNISYQGVFVPGLHDATPTISRITHIVSKPYDF